jgi:hypothetical protein
MYTELEAGTSNRAVKGNALAKQGANSAIVKRYRGTGSNCEVWTSAIGNQIRKVKPAKSPVGKIPDLIGCCAHLASIEPTISVNGMGQIKRETITAFPLQGRLCSSAGFLRGLGLGSV